MFVLSLELPVAVVDTSKGLSADKFKEELERGALTVKSVYWYASLEVNNTGP